MAYRWPIGKSGQMSCKWQPEKSKLTQKGADDVRDMSSCLSSSVCQEKFPNAQQRGEQEATLRVVNSRLGSKERDIPDSPPGDLKLATCPCSWLGDY